MVQWENALEHLFFSICHVQCSTDKYCTVQVRQQLLWLNIYLSHGKTATKCNSRSELCGLGRTIVGLWASRTAEKSGTMPLHPANLCLQCCRTWWNLFHMEGLCSKHYIYFGGGGVIMELRFGEEQYL